MGQKRGNARADDDLAHQMHLLAQAFKAYEVDDIACQMYVACASSLSDPALSGSPLTTKVKNIMRSLEKIGLSSVKVKDYYVADLLEAFRYGDSSKECGLLKDRCVKKNN